MTSKPLSKLTHEERLEIYKDFIGKKFGNLTVVVANQKGIICFCDCGKTRKSTYFQLMAGRHKSCGCQHATSRNKVKDTHIGKKYGFFKVIKFVGINKKNQSLFLLRCKCGKEKTYPSVHLGQTFSCGCSRVAYWKGNIHPARKITDKQREEIKKLHEQYDYKILAEWFKVSESTIKKVVNGWGDYSKDI